MNNRIIISIFFLILSTFVFGQRKKDQVKANVMGPDNFIDSIPHFIFAKAELDSFFILTSRIPQEADVNGINAFVRLSFHIDSSNQINSVEVLESRPIIVQDMFKWSSDSAFVLTRNHYRSEAIRMINCTNGMWMHGMKQGKYFDGKVIVDINFKTETFERNQKIAKDLKSGATTTGHSYAVEIQAVGAPVNHMKLKGNYDVGVRKMNQKKYELAILYFKEAIDYNSKESMLTIIWELRIIN